MDGSDHTFDPTTHSYLLSKQHQAVRSSYPSRLFLRWPFPNWAISNLAHFQPWPFPTIAISNLAHFQPCPFSTLAIANQAISNLGHCHFQPWPFLTLTISNLGISHLDLPLTPHYTYLLSQQCQEIENTERRNSLDGY